MLALTSNCLSFPRFPQPILLLMYYLPMGTLTVDTARESPPRKRWGPVIASPVLHASLMRDETVTYGRHGLAGTLAFRTE